jgi:preprotein translocase subunit SecF
MRVFEHANYAFIENRKKAYAVSAVLLAITVGAMIFNIATIGSWMNYGVDFTGGSLVQVRFAQTIDEAQLRAALGGANAPPITRFGDAGANEFVIRAPLSETSITAVAEEIEAQIAAGMPSQSFEVVRTELVGAKVGSELQQRAALAILISFGLTLVYLAVRFELRFGLAAVIATAHDIMLTLGLLAIFRMEISLTTIAALLTILGYSLNDTIVVFDRIRENLRVPARTAHDAILNRSVNQSLSRTIITSGTTILVVMILLIFGGEVLQDFAFALVVGIVVGTYSSIFIATPVLVEWQKRWPRKVK